MCSKKFGIPLILYALLFLWQPLQAQDQKTFNNQGVLWSSVNGSVQWNERWQSNIQIQHRLFFDPKGQYQLLTILNSLYSLPKLNASIGGGYTSFFFRISVSGEEDHLVVPELRPFQFFIYKVKREKSTLTFRMVAEERWIRNFAGKELTNGHTFNLRLRFLADLEIPLKAGESGFQPAIKISVEPMVRFFSGNRFEQQRTIAGFNLKMNSKSGFFIGYMHWLFNRDGLFDFDNRHVALLGLNYKLK